MKTEVKVWDPLVRVFHWSLVASFIVAYLSGEDWELLHVLSGYVVLGLITVRIAWGFVGSRYARFSSFIVSPAVVIDYLKALRRFDAKRYLGHNPAGAAMVVTLLVLIVGACISGLVLYAAEDHAGPLAGLVGGISGTGIEVLEEVHEVSANLAVLAVLVHIMGVIFSSFLHNENLPRAMITGRKKAEPIEK